MAVFEGNLEKRSRNLSGVSQSAMPDRCHDLLGIPEDEAP